MHSPTLRSIALVGALVAVIHANTAFVNAAPDDLPPHPSPSSKCYCQPTDPCWPNDATWSALNTAVGGRLIPTKPAAYECHDPHYDAAKCQEIQKGYHFDYWRHKQPGAVEQTNWEVFNYRSCRGFNQTEPCYQGAVPLYSVNVTNVQDVQHAVRFAAKNNIRLVIKNTGHDYLGRSIGVSSLNVWVHHLKKIALDDNFVPEGAPRRTPGQGAIILDPGVIWQEAYAAANEHNVTVVGGAHPTVGTSGGYCQGGGHSPLSPRHGLCVDNVLQYKVVTADGQLRVANAYKNKDLFWALRGGGGSTFGVIVEAVYKTHPAITEFSYAGYRIGFNGTEARRKVYTSFLSQQLAWGAAGYSGYSYFQLEGLMFYYMFPGVGSTVVNSTMSAFLKEIASIPNITIEGEAVSAGSFWEAFGPLVTNNTEPTSGSNTILGSRLIPKANFEDAAGISQLVDVMMEAQDDLGKLMGPAGATVLGHLVAGGQVSKGNSRETSVLPAWRKALFHVVVAAFWPDTAHPGAPQYMGEKITATTQRFRDISPGSGAYFNEADPNEPDWQEAFFGSNYPRLRAIKRKLDPRGVFVCHNCVGSEDWNKELTCRL
ncbi:hypothetical protein BX616_004404 [Lobosporangium transversale]|uniref:FAD-binding PCMH-type domain-containing protein n=1 Tax=Lobosporangium transversale TaxID=64571 RepID=A0A1Y2GG64_9FUNG|nr:hypothetical protein BCR41DRAFT_358016 [Lobosporangium transversale]KAF9898158.1 hypothetical protein BX616_004404 [Lobosporangium transversale]ORZ09968.1 hypothetical protein BCR41DRAFT_358016 [Lobosporangium transversale]|eukprot:XP_021879058.1 hypothetical protein BCR41DRAFT_358016 [Lobosporangium transversale]